jgi:hypothetical protein
LRHQEELDTYDREATARSTVADQAGSEHELSRR